MLKIHQNSPKSPQNHCEEIHVMGNQRKMVHLRPVNRQFCTDIELNVEHTKHSLRLFQNFNLKTYKNRENMVGKFTRC